MRDESTVVVRRRWNGPETTEVSLTSLWDLHVRDVPGGVCRALPRGFLFARVWCDKLASGALGHSCRVSPPPPHELLVCILPTDNAAVTYEHLRRMARG